eukprot:6044906-Pyramimonas_sp.AAC.1
MMWHFVEAPPAVPGLVGTVPVPSWALRGASWRCLEASWGLQGGFLGASWGPRGGLLGLLGGSLGGELEMSVPASPLGALLGRSLSFLRGSWRPLGPSCGRLGPSGRCLEGC